jgi:16S rRNA (adenine1518-N6/adenine1519-N6)-dimethyltransferase
LQDEAIAKRIALLTVQDADAPRVLEVGAGTGVLTAALHATGAKLTALEIDPRLVDILRQRSDLTGVEIVEGDALQFDFARFASAGGWRLAGNLPYNVGTPLVVEVVRLPRPPERMVVMLQKDVIDRLVAKPRTPAYGSLTLIVASRMRVTRAFTIGRSHFYPQPNVDSSVAVLEPSPHRGIPDLTVFDAFVKAGFAYRRKTLATPREKTVAALRSLGIDAEARAEELDLATFAQLACELAV